MFTDSKNLEKVVSLIILSILAFSKMGLYRKEWPELENFTQFFFNMVKFVCTGENPRWPMVAILEKTIMDRIMSDTTFLRFLGSVNIILALF